MEGTKFLRSTQIIILGVCIAFATIVSTVILSRGFMKVKKYSNEVISVAGSAEKKILSDYIVWGSEFSVRDPQMTAAFARLKNDLEKVKAYLLGKGVKEDEIIASQIDTKVFYKKTEKGQDTNEIEGYLLKQDIEVRSYDVENVVKISRQSTELIDQDIHFLSRFPDFFYTKLADLKIEMLSEATEDAKKRALSMATSAGNRIGLMRSAKMGVFQITPVNSYDVSWWGNNDTSSYEKKVTAVAHVSFAIEE
ncbi:MAG: SIMPL domain-containing protein [Candidatus Omnitrophica bacterium]|nr:SIMPL domain-containing protein [Candidatus Omnitrophota bacterium]